MDASRVDGVRRPEGHRTPRRDVRSRLAILNRHDKEVDEPIQRIGVDGLDVLQTRDAEEQDLRTVGHLRGPTLTKLPRGDRAL